MSLLIMSILIKSMFRLFKGMEKVVVLTLGYIT